MTGTATETPTTRMLVIATLLCSYPGIDATGQAHLEYPPNTYVIPTPDPVMFPESFYMHCFEKGIDGILIASSGLIARTKAHMSSSPLGSRRCTPR
jgi:coenzyme F420-reducing hydrogenase delta subunit